VNCRQFVELISFVFPSFSLASDRIHNYTAPSLMNTKHPESSRKPTPQQMNPERPELIAMTAPNTKHICPCNTIEPTSGDRLPDEVFQSIVRLTPLVAIDLIVRRADGRIWLGRRKNPPAKNRLFVPGGRITKNETRAEAFERITKDELGVRIPLTKAVFLDSLDHIYKENYREKTGFGTHYVTLGFEVGWSGKSDPKSNGQHLDCVWMTRKELCESSEVHEFTKLYFQNAGGTPRE
jgi:colanic acid biosynthesis protein WcaH